MLRFISYYLESPRKRERFVIHADFRDLHLFPRRFQGSSIIGFRSKGAQSHRPRLRRDRPSDGAEGRCRLGDATTDGDASPPCLPAWQQKLHDLRGVVVSASPRRRLSKQCMFDLQTSRFCVRRFGLSGHLLRATSRVWFSDGFQQHGPQSSYKTLFKTTSKPRSGTSASRAGRASAGNTGRATFESVASGDSIC